MAAICNLFMCPSDKARRCFGCPSGGPNPRVAIYTPTPQADPVALIRRANALLSRWVELYGEFNPQWLPPAGIVSWQEDAAQYISAHTLPAPTSPGFAAIHEQTQAEARDILRGEK